MYIIISHYCNSPFYHFIGEKNPLENVHVVLCLGLVRCYSSIDSVINEPQWSCLVHIGVIHITHAGYQKIVASEREKGKKLWRESKRALERLELDRDGKAFGDTALHEQKNPTRSGGRADLWEYYS